MGSEPSETETSLGSVADRLLEAAGKADDMSMDMLIRALGERSHYTLILVIATLAATPLSGIPGVSIVCGLLIAIIAGERIVCGDRVRLPAWAKRQSLPAGKVRKTLEKLRPIIDWVDRHTHRRLGWVMASPMNRLPLLVCLAGGLTMPFLELIPFTSSIVASGITLISVGMITRDGVFVSLALIPFAALVWLGTSAI